VKIFDPVCEDDTIKKEYCELNNQLAEIDVDKLQALLKREFTRHAERNPKSQTLLANAKKVMPSGVPMAWMSGFYEAPPVFVAKGEGAYFEDVDGNRYLDMNQADLAASCGFTPAAVIEAVKDQITKGTAFLLPTESATEVAELLVERYDLPKWQFTLAASSANTEAIRLARAATGRDEVLMFFGRYHGHWDDVMVESTPEQSRVELMGLPSDAGSRASNVPFNNLNELEAALKTRRYACLIAEPAMTNCILVQPDEGFWSQAYALCQKYGSLLILDETHTQTFAYGGLKTLWNLDCDIISMGKCLGGGIAIGAYGMTEELAQITIDNIDRYRGGNVLPLGGTLFGNALSMVAAKATLQNVLTLQAYQKLNQLGEQLANGLNQIFDDHDLPWHAPQLGGRSGYYLTSDIPRNSEEAGQSIVYELIDARRCFLSNRGIWDAIASAGPSASFAHQSCDIDVYLSAVNEFITEIRR
jgi:glutamate-1-semialdehyde 2,1-aminomutase